MIELRLMCPVCNHNASSFYRQVYDDRYGFPGSFNLYKCKICGHIYLKTRFREDELTDLYTNYYPRSGFDIKNFSQKKEVRGLSSWIKGIKFSAYTYVPQNVRVLDIGCGFGETLAYHKARGCEAYGSEIDQNAAYIAKKLGLNIKVGTYNSKNYEEGFFDFITLDQVIEHVDDPDELLQGIFTNLKKGGVAIISTPNAKGWGQRWFKNRWLHWHAPYHLHFFSNKSMKIAAKKNNLKIIKVNYVTLSDWLYWQWIHLIFLPALNEPSLFWKYMNKRMYSKGQLIKLEKLEKIKKYRIHDIITRLFDLLHLGDNKVFIIKKIS